jgi:hypothetical protein
MSSGCATPPALWLDVGLPTGRVGLVVVEVVAVGAGRGQAAGVTGGGFKEYLEIKTIGLPA